MIDYSKLQNGSDVRGVALPLVAAEPVTLTEEAAGQIAADLHHRARHRPRRARRAED